MSGIIEILLKVAPLITVAFVLIKFNITSTNKTVIDILLTPKNNRDWDDFLEIISVSLILVLTIVIPSIFFDYSKMSAMSQYIFITIDIGLIIITGIFLVVSWLLSLFGVLLRSKLVNFVIITSLALILFLSFFSSALNQKYLVNFFYTKQYSNLLVIIGSIFIFFTLLFYIYRFIYKSFNKPISPTYKIEKIPVNLVEEELKNLYFIYMFDSERHIMTNYPVNRKSVTFPAYVYYPKENSLVKYKKD